MTITLWADDAAFVLLDCIGCTDTTEATTHKGELDLEEYATSVSGYISKCVYDVTTIRTVTIHANQKPWLNTEVRSLLRTGVAAFRTADAQSLRGA